MAFDSPPISGDVSRIADFTAIHLYPAISAQLFRATEFGTRVVDGAACLHTVSADFQRYDVRLHQRLTWQDGAPVTPEDYVRALNRIKVVGAPLQARFTELDRVEWRQPDSAGADGGYLIFHLSRPDTHFIRKLAHPSVSPYRERRNDSSPPYAAGPYFFRRLSESGAVLERCAGSPSGPASECHIHFIASADEAVRLFESHLLDVTCAASFPLDAVGVLSSSTFFRRAPSTTFFVLVPCSARASTLALRQAIASCVDNASIHRHWPGGVARFAGFTAFSDVTGGADSAPAVAIPGQRADLFVRETLYRASSECALTIGVDDYAPNPAVARAVARAIADAGGAATLVPDRYEAPSRDYDFRLAVLLNSTTYPLDAYRRIAASSALVGDQTLRQSFLAAIASYDAATDDIEAAHAVASLDTMVRESLPVIPLARLNQMYLSRSDVGDPWTGDAFWTARTPATAQY